MLFNVNVIFCQLCYLMLRLFVVSGELLSVCYLMLFLVSGEFVISSQW